MNDDEIHAAVKAAFENGKRFGREQLQAELQTLLDVPSSKDV